MKLQKMALGLMLTSSLASSFAHANPDLSADTEITMDVAKFGEEGGKAMIKGLDDMYLGVSDGINLMRDGDEFYIYASGYAADTKYGPISVQIDGSAGDGGFYLTNKADPDQKIPFTVFFRDGEDLKKATAGTVHEFVDLNSIALSRDGADMVSTTNNAALEVLVDAGAASQVSAGKYLGTVTLTIVAD